MLALSADSATLWVTVGLALLSVLLATVEHGWQKLSHSKLLESAQGPSSRTRLERLLDRRDDAESALIVLRVATLVALVMSLLLLVGEVLGEGLSMQVVLWTGPISFFWIMLFCRLLPDELGTDRLQRVVRVTMPAAVALGSVLAPPIAGLRNVLRRLTGHTEEDEAEMVADEILASVEEGEREGHLGGHQVEMIEKVLELSEVEVHQHMTPRTDIEVIDISSTIGEARKVALETGRSRYPLVEDDDVDRVVGVVHVKDLLTKEKTEPVEVVKRAPWFVPESKFCTDLLQEFRQHRTHLAIVLDEYGGTAGLITIEDVLEEIVGEIDDEFDKEEDGAELQILDPRHAVAPGTIHVDELNDALSIALPESDDWTTLGGFIFNTLGRLPEQGEELVQENVTLRVESVVERRVERVAVEIAEAAA